MSDSFSPVNDISDTAYLVAMYRALETERPDALLLLIPWLVKEPWETFCKRDGIVLLESI